MRISILLLMFSNLLMISGCNSCATFLAGYEVSATILNANNGPIRSAEIDIVFETDGSPIESLSSFAGNTDEFGNLEGLIETGFASGCGLLEAPGNIQLPPVPTTARITIVAEEGVFDVVVSVPSTFVVDVSPHVLRIDLGAVQTP